MTPKTYGYIRVSTREQNEDRQVIRVQGHIEEGPLKTKNAYRTVAIGDDVITILKDLQEREGKRSP